MKNQTICGLFLCLLSFLPLGLRAEDSQSDDLKVVSLNMRYGEAKDGTNSWQYRFPATIMMLRDQVPDVMGVQEALGYQIGMVLYDCENYKSIGVGRENGKKQGEHMSLLYNKKTISLSKWGTYWLSETPDKPSKGWDAACKRTATWALMKCKKSGKKFYIVNTHLDHVGVEARVKGLQLVVDRIAQMNKKNYPLILMGDFNVLPNDDALVGLNEVMKDTRKAAAKTDNLHTFNNWGRSKSIIDYIYFKGFSQCKEFQTIQKKYAERAFISDHFPIKAVFEF